MKVLSGQEAKDINKVVENNLNEQAIIFSDKARNFVDIAEFVEGHLTEHSDEHTSKNPLGWVHMAVANAKRMFLGIYHKFHGSRLRNYLAEFCYKLNHRHFGGRKFERLTTAITLSKFIQTI